MSISSNLRNYANAIARASPDAIIVVASPPVNCLLPIMSQLLAKYGCYNHNKVVGSTTVDTVRASALLARHLNLDPKEVVLPVIGGSSERTRVPMFSQSRPLFSLKKDVKTNLIMDIRRGDSKILANKGSPEVLNRAYSTVRFLNSIMAGLRGDSNATDITLCRTDLVPGVEYFSLPVTFGKDGIIKRFGVPKTTPAEEEMVEEAIKFVKKDSDKAAYIVKGSIDLSSEQKYQSTNERASSQKEMFDLYVKSLPKISENSNDPKHDRLSKNSTDYSFEDLIKKESHINPFDVFEKKPYRSKACNQLRNVVSEDTFLRSAGLLTSPFERPILVLEPLQCPSAPLPDGENETSELDQEEILHENTLQCSQNGGNFSVKSARERVRGPFSAQSVAQRKNVDPIAKLKAQSGERPERMPKNECAKSVSKSDVPTYSDITKKVAIGSVRDDKLEVKVRGDSRINYTNSPKVRSKSGHSSGALEGNAGKEGLSCQASNGNSAESTSKKSDLENKITSYLYNVKSNRRMPSPNRRKKRAREETEQTEMQQDCSRTHVEYGDFAEAATDVPQNEEKYKKMVSRLLRKLDGLSGMSILPHKSFDDRPSKVKRTFTESAVRSSPPSFRKPKFMTKSQPVEEQNEDCDEKPIIVRRKKKWSGKRWMEPGVASSKCVQNECEVEAYVADDNKEWTHFLCPKCRNPISVQPVKCLPAENDSSKNHGLREKNSVEIKIDQEDGRDGRPKRKVVISDYKFHNSQDSKEKTPQQLQQQEDRLRKLKEKIKLKLVPLLNGNVNPSSDKSVNIIQLPERISHSAKVGLTRNLQHFAGTPLVLVKDGGQNKIIVDEGLKTSASNWQGTPFVVKQHEDIQDVKTKRYQNPEEKDEVTSNPAGDEDLEKDSEKEKRAGKGLNKLQQLIIDAENKSKVGDLKEAGREEATEEKFVKKRGADLKGEDVRHYMLSREKVERKPQPKTQSTEEKLLVAKDAECDPKTEKKSKVDTRSFGQLSEEMSKKDANVDAENVSKDQNALAAEAKPGVEILSSSEDKPSKTALNEAMTKSEDKAVSMQPFIKTSNPAEATASEKFNEAQAGPKVTQSSFAPNKSDSVKKGTILETVANYARPANKLQLLARSRISGRTVQDVSTKKKLQIVWDKFGSAPYAFKNGKIYKPSARTGENLMKLEKRSAAVKMARTSVVKEKPLKVFRAEKPVFIRGGAASALRVRKRKPTNNLLQELATTASVREKRVEEAQKLKASKKPNFRPLQHVQLFTNVAQSRKPSANEKIFTGISPEYGSTEERTAKLASEMIMKKKLHRPKFDVRDQKPSKTNKMSELPKKPTTANGLKSKFMDLSSISEWRNDAASLKTFGDVESKLTSLPHVRHQMENVELPLGPLEIQSGSRPLNMRSCFPNSENSWESAITNEYVRSNMLPSLKDTRESFYLEERPII